jgi:hypothetical protein
MAPRRRALMLLLESALQATELSGQVIVQRWCGLRPGNEQRINNQECCTHRNGSIGHVERRERPAPDPDLEEIHAFKADRSSDATAHQGPGKTSRKYCLRSARRRHNQSPMNPLTTLASTINAQRCQPPASARKLNAAPVFRWCVILIKPFSGIFSYNDTHLMIASLVS